MRPQSPVRPHMQTLCRIVVLTCSLMLGCKHAGTKAAEQTRAMPAAADDLPGNGPLTVSLSPMLVQGKVERPLLATEALHAGDHVYFIVRASQPAYLYVILHEPSGTRSVLYPRPGASPRIAARCSVPIPAQGSFYVRNPPGNLDLRVLASAEPLGQSDPRLCEQLQLSCDTSGPEAVPTCPKERARALFPSMQVASAAPQGVASLRLVLRQEP